MEFAWTKNNNLTETQQQNFLKYIQLNKNNLIEINNFIFDKISLTNNICLSQCLECGNFQSENCCPGSSYTMTDENEDNLKSILDDIIKYTNDPILLKKQQSNHLITNKARTSIETSQWFGKKQTHCVFSRNLNNKTCCIIHAYCLTKNLNPIKFKPYICSAFPIFGINYNNKTYIFNITKETESFTFYHYTLTRRFCINEINLKRLLTKNNINKNKYLSTCNVNNFDHTKMKPAYIEQENFLKTICSEQIYNELKQKINITIINKEIQTNTQKQLNLI